MQPQFASRLLKALKRGGYHTALDTCGQVEWTTLRGLLSHVDLVLYDLKHMDTPRALVVYPAEQAPPTFKTHSKNHLRDFIRENSSEKVK